MSWQKIAAVFGALFLIALLAWFTFGRKEEVVLTESVPAGQNAAGYQNEDAERFLSESQRSSTAE